MKVILLLLFLTLVISCSTPKTQSKALELQTENSVPISINTPAPKNTTKQDLIENLINAPKLVHYGEDGAMDASVLKLYNIDTDGTTNPPVKEVADIVALREKAIPLLIEHLDDNRQSSATFHGGYLPDVVEKVKVPVGHVCLDILLNIVDSSFYYDKSCEIDTRLEGCIKDGLYFRPDDYWILGGDSFVERPIVRIVKANWQKAYKQGRLKYNFKVTWK
ncbi:MAG TPA: hypothetical protein PKE69_15100 [Pyrinomonadaceae bacterium]|nr:hypothetical protein [Pyrinomonadaceae bacterium]